MNKEQWIKENLQPGEKYGGLMPGHNGAPDAHLVVLDVCKVLTFRSALSLAEGWRGSLPTPQELMQLYLWLPEMFRAPPGALSGGSPTLRRFWSSRPAMAELCDRSLEPNANRYWGVAPEAMNLSATFYPDTYKVCQAVSENDKLATVVIRRITLGDAMVRTTVEDDLPAWLLQLDAKLKELGFVKATVSFQLPSNAVLQYRTLQWRSTLNDKAYELDLVCQNAGPFNEAPWHGLVKWDILELGEVFERIYTDKKGCLPAGDQLVEQILAGAGQLATRKD